jgi:transcriptional regulator with XRE-family HTH domain
MTFGERVLKLRTEKGMTQDELALAVGYKSRSTIAKIESGERDPHQSMIAAIAKALDTTPAYLMGWEEQAKKADDLSALMQERSADSSHSKNDSYSHDIRRIERARKLMPPEKWNSMMKTVEAAFSEYFNDDYVDDDLDE